MPQYYGDPYPMQTQPRPTAMPDWWPTNQPSRPQPQRPQFLPGKYINTLQDIVPQDVPTDGSIGIFPQSDYAAIYLKKWDGNGTISTVKYIPELPTQQPSPEQQFQSSIETRLTNMEKMLTSLMDIWQPKAKEENS